MPSVTPQRCRAEKMKSQVVMASGGRNLLHQQSHAHNGKGFRSASALLVHPSQHIRALLRNIKAVSANFRTMSLENILAHKNQVWLHETAVMVADANDLKAG